jgi:ribosomal protein L17
MEEEENEQLDYDEDELEAARKKAKEIQKEAELVTTAATQQPSTQQPHAQPQTNDEFVVNIKKN